MKSQTLYASGAGSVTVRTGADSMAGNAAVSLGAAALLCINHFFDKPNINNLIRTIL
jgi:hypothetical protein